MNKEWMMAPRLSNEYLKGVEDFLEFLRANRQKLGGDDWYCCPCVKCRNLKGGKKTLGDIYDHLICHGIYRYKLHNMDYKLSYKLKWLIWKKD